MPVLRATGRPRARRGAALAVLAVLLTTGAAAGAGTASSGSSAAPVAVVPDRDGARTGHVLEQRIIGRSARGREIRAWHLDNRGERAHRDPTVVLISTMHGDEGHTRRILDSLRTGRAVHGVDLWLVPVHNPDGLARHTRRNARGVDLNRNFPYRWADLDGSYESGPRPASEPETRAMMRFLREVDPDYVLSFHQPLHGVDTDNKRPGFSRHVARTLRLPATTLDCGGVCHGTMTGWFNHHFGGFALTVEYGARPSRERMTREAPRQVLAVFDAFAGGPAQRE